MLGDDAARVVKRTTISGDVKRITRAKHIGAFARDDVQWTS